MRSPRTPLLVALCSVALCACFGHRTADEEVIEVEPNLAFDAGEDPSSSDDERDAESDTLQEPAHDAGTSASDAGAASSCANETDPIAALLCTLGAGSGTDIQDIIGGVLGGGMQGTNCSGLSDPISLLLCQATGSGGTGIEGIINDLLGGGNINNLLPDGGIAGVVTDAIAQVVRGLIDDLISSLLAPFNRDGGAGGFFGGGRTTNNAQNRVLVVDGNKGRPEELSRSEEECANAAQDDLLTRLVCARQKLDQL